MILVGYLVEAAPQVLIWWGGFHLWGRMKSNCFSKKHYL